MSTTEIAKRLTPAFSPRQANVLADVIVESGAAHVATSDFTELKAIVRDIAIAQARNEKHLEELSRELKEQAAAHEREMKERAEAHDREMKGISEEIKGVNETHAQKMALMAEAHEREMKELAEAQARWMKEFSEDMKAKSEEHD